MQAISNACTSSQSGLLLKSEKLPFLGEEGKETCVGITNTNRRRVLFDRMIGSSQNSVDGQTGPARTSLPPPLLLNEKTLLDSGRPCSSSSSCSSSFSSTNTDECPSISSSSTFTCTDHHQQHQQGKSNWSSSTFPSRSLTVTMTDEHGNVKVSTVAKGGRGIDQQPLLYSEYIDEDEDYDDVISYGQRGRSEHDKMKWKLKGAEAIEKRRKYRQCNYSVLGNNSLGMSKAGRISTRSEKRASRGISLSASSPLGFHRSPSSRSEKKYVNVDDSPSVISDDGKGIEGDVRRREQCANGLEHGYNAESNIASYWCSLPSSNNLNLPLCTVTAAESLPTLPSQEDPADTRDMAEGSAVTVAGLAPVESVHSNGLNAKGSIIPRRHSGLASIRYSVVSPGAGSATQTPIKHKLSQPSTQKTSACSLMMVSPNAVSRTPSQQWHRNSTSTCTGLMSTSPIPLPSTPPSIHIQPDPSIDPRTTLSPTPGQGSQNPLYNVSNEFMRTCGYTQQFKRLLSKRNSSLNKEPTTETSQIPGSIDMGKERDVEKGEQVQTGVMVEQDSYDPHGIAAAALAAGSVIVSPGIGTTGHVENGPNGDIKPSGDPKRRCRKNAYGRVWKEQPNFKHRLKQRKQLYTRRTKISDFALFFAIIGIVFTVLESELTASGTIPKEGHVSISLRILIVISTLVLILLIVSYHAIETQLSVIDSGAEDWRIAITNDRIWQCALEIAICSICPFPINVNVSWDRLKSDHRTPYPVSVPLDAVLSVPMFLRFYLFGRFMALHSRQFQDAATRSIAALNHIAVNFTFVLKTLMYEHPLRVMILFTVVFWVTMSWILTQCERYASGDEEGENEKNHYLNSIWFVIITFMSIGYGDIVPNTYCGRALAITTGIMGAGVSSALIAVISRKLELTRAEKHVNQFMTDSKLMRQRKEAAAAVLQHTWFIHKYKNIPKAKDDAKLRMHQRRFLASINEFRRVKWDQRKLAEQGNALVDVAKLQSEMHETLWDMQQNQDHLVAQMEMLMQKVQVLQELILTSHQTNPSQFLHVQGGRKYGTRDRSPSSPATQIKKPIVIAQDVEDLEGIPHNDDPANMTV